MPTVWQSAMIDKALRHDVQRNVSETSRKKPPFLPLRDKFTSFRNATGHLKALMPWHSDACSPPRSLSRQYTTTARRFLEDNIKVETSVVPTHHRPGIAVSLRSFGRLFSGRSSNLPLRVEFGHSCHT